MKIHKLTQGSAEWHKFRAAHDTASEAPTIMGKGYKSRNVFIKEQATGIEEEISDFVQRLFDQGHEAERLARPICEKLFKKKFSAVTGTHDKNEKLSASLDGLSVCETVIWEHKLWNKTLPKQIAAEKLDPKYSWQLEQQLYVSGADYAIITCSDGTEENMVHMEYRPVNGRVKKLLAAWDQYHDDLQEYIDNMGDSVIEGEAVEIKQTKIEYLPVLAYEMNGMAVSSNLADYKKAALVILKDSEKKIETDQDFADADKLSKELRSSEKALKELRAKLKTEAVDINALDEDLAELQEIVRKGALNGENQVKARKLEIREEKIVKYKKEFDSAFDEVNQSLGNFHMPKPVADFGLAMKGLKTLESLDNACNDHLSELEVECKIHHDRVSSNAIHYAKEAKDFEYLFPNISDLAAEKDEESFADMISSNILKEKDRLKEKAEEQRLADEKELEEANKKPALEDFPIVDDMPAANGEDPNTSPQAKAVIIHTPSGTSVFEQRHKVHVAIKTTMVEYGISEHQATMLIKLISSGQIPYTSIQYNQGEV